MSLDLFADLEWRGLLAQTTDREALVKELKSAPTKFYIGFDPTAPSLHVGIPEQKLVWSNLNYWP